MSHNIAKIKGKDAVAYMGETPWHRLGTPMANEPFKKGESEVGRAMRLASLDWQVNLEEMVLRTDPKRVVPSRMAVVRDTDGEVLATVGSDYRCLQNREAFHVLDRACLDHGVKIEVAGALGRGDRVWMLAKLPESIEVVPGDNVDGYFLITTGHNGWWAYRAMPTAVRVVCANTLSAAMEAGQAPIKLYHRDSDMKQMQMVAVTISKMVEALRKTGDTFRKLATKQMSLPEIEEYITAVLGIDEDEVTTQQENRRLEILELAEHGRGSEFARGTAWGAFNAITEYVDHRRSATAAPKTLRQADQSSLFGPGARLKVRALNLALQA